MRKRFGQQFVLGRVPIEVTEIPNQKRSNAQLALCAALKEVFTPSEWKKRYSGYLREKYLRERKRPASQVWICGRYLFCRKYVYTLKFIRFWLNNVKCFQSFV
jgi:hypothetical protein